MAFTASFLKPLPGIFLAIPKGEHVFVQPLRPLTVCYRLYPGRAYYQDEVRFGHLFLAFTVLAIVIACIGLFALVSFSTTLRIKEIGIPKVLGASVGNLMILLSKEYVVLISVSTALAIPMILYFSATWLENYASRIDIAFDLFVVPALVLVVISLLTVSQRTYSTAKSDPVRSLRTA